MASKFESKFNEREEFSKRKRERGEIERLENEIGAALMSKYSRKRKIREIYLRAPRKKVTQAPGTTIALHRGTRNLPLPAHSMASLYEKLWQ